MPYVRDKGFWQIGCRPLHEQPAKYENNHLRLGVNIEAEHIPKGRLI